MNATHEVILHHYSGSPYAEKIRLLLGYKKLPWRSLVIPEVPPRPSLQPIFGAFRRTPVLQLGADFFCDTRLITEVIERLAPNKPLSSKSNRILSTLICGWVEPRAFVMTGPVRFQSTADVDGVFDGAVSVTTFATDRTPFMSPAIQAERFAAMRPSSEDHLRAYLTAIEELLVDREYVGGERPCFADFSVYHLVWWLRAPPTRTELLQDLPHVRAWADRMAAIGHGSPQPIDAAEGLAVVHRAQANAAWQSPWKKQPDDRVGRQVAIVPDDYGRNAMSGTMIDSTEQHVTLQYPVDSLGVVRVHFPRLGYEIAAT